MAVVLRRCPAGRLCKDALHGYLIFGNPFCLADLFQLGICSMDVLPHIAPKLFHLEQRWLVARHVSHVAHKDFIMKSLEGGEFFPGR